MPKYTKLLPPEEYDRLTLDEKAAYIVDMADLLKHPAESPAPADPNPPAEPDPPDDKPKTP